MVKQLKPDLGVSAQVIQVPFKTCLKVQVDSDFTGMLSFFPKITTVFHNQSQG